MEGLSIAIPLISGLLAKHLNFDSPHFLPYGTRPNYDMLHTFGYICFVHVPTYERYMLGAQLLCCAFMSHSIAQKDFVCYDGIAKCFHTFRNVVFFEYQYYFQQNIVKSSELTPLVSFEDGSRSIKRFKPGMIYQRQKLPAPPPLLDLDLFPNSAVRR